MSTDYLGRLRPGDQLGNLEYLIDEAVLAEYQRLAGQNSRYPNLLANDCRALLLKRCGQLPLTAIWQGFDFYRPPIPGRRVQVGGWLRDVLGSPDQPQLLVDAFAVDEIGTEILRSKATYAIGAVDAPGADSSVLEGNAKPPQSREGTDPTAATANPADLTVGDTLPTEQFALPQGLSLATWSSLGSRLAGVDLGFDDSLAAGTVAGWLEGWLSGYFGDDFRWGGSLGIGFHAPPNRSEVLRGEAKVTQRQVYDSGAVAFEVFITVYNERGQQDALVSARMTVPSPRTL